MSNSAAAFKTFHRVAESTIGRVLGSHGYKGPESQEFGREASIVYRLGDAVAVSINYEVLGPIWVEVTVATPGRRQPSANFTLDYMITARCPSETLPAMSGDSTAEQKDVRAYLLAVVDIISRRFPEILQTPEDIGDRFVAEFSS